MNNSESRLAVLVSGGIDSAVYLAEALHQNEAVYPLYLRFGLSWETDELRYLQRFLEEIQDAALQRLTVLESPVQDVYGNHWSINARDVPGYDAPDEEVFLPGRNVFLLSKAMLWCHLHDVPSVALGSLQSNPFPDATPEFFAQFEKVMNQAIQGDVRIQLPYAGLPKTEVLRRAAGLPLQWTFSCIRPQNGLHCGDCNKCGERQRAFLSAKIADPTEYAE